jgi:hypothetical protein
VIDSSQQRYLPRTRCRHEELTDRHAGAHFRSSYADFPMPSVAIARTSPIHLAISPPRDKLLNPPLLSGRHAARQRLHEEAFKRLLELKRRWARTIADERLLACINSLRRRKNSTPRSASETRRENSRRLASSTLPGRIRQDLPPDMREGSACED